MEEGEATSPNPGAANKTIQVAEAVEIFEGAAAVGPGEEGEGEGETLTTEAAEVVEAKAVAGVEVEVAVDLRHISGEGTLECGMPHNRRERTPSTEGKGPFIVISH